MGLIPVEIHKFICKAPTTPYSKQKKWAHIEICTVVYGAVENIM